jgi:hypothetical protein
MNYMAVLQRTEHDKNTEFALYHVNRVGEIVKKKERYNVDAELLNKYNEKKANFKNFGEDWTEDEIAVVYINMVNTRKTKDERKTLLQTACDLERTLFAVKWCILHLFSEKADLHRSNIMIEFRKQLGLDKGV